jgi:hypothetical protein
MSSVTLRPHFMNCEYLTRNGQHAKLEECGQPATHRGVKAPKKHYCAAHAKLVGRPGGIKLEPIKGLLTEK